MKIWRDATSGDLFHDACFDDDESREGYVLVKQDDLEDEDECASCGGNFLLELSDEEEDEEDLEEDEEA